MSHLFARTAYELILPFLTPAEVGTRPFSVKGLSENRQNYDISCFRIHKTSTLGFRIYLPIFSY